MEETIRQLANGIFPCKVPNLILSEEKIKLSVFAGEKKKGFFKIYNDQQRKMKVRIYSSSPFLQIQQTEFFKEELDICYEFDASILLPGEQFYAWIQIVSALGERKVAVQIQAEAPYYESALGKITDLTQFVTLANQNWEEACLFFWSEQFQTLFCQKELKIQMLYHAACQNQDHHAALEQFLVAMDQKSNIRIKAQKTEWTFEIGEQTERREIWIEMSTWGYGCLICSTQAPFLQIVQAKQSLFFEKKKTHAITVQIDPQKMHFGTNRAVLKLQMNDQIVVLSVFCKKKQKVEQKGQGMIVYLPKQKKKEWLYEWKMAKIYRENPDQFEKLTKETEQILFFAVWNRLCTKEIIEKYMYFVCRDAVFTVWRFLTLKQIFLDTKSKESLTALCMTLIAGHCTGKQFFQWYQVAINEGIELEQLYEYYMLSLDVTKEQTISNRVLQYFLYQNRLPDLQKKQLYIFIVQHKKEIPEFYRAYKEQMRLFLIQRKEEVARDPFFAKLYFDLLEQIEQREKPIEQVSRKERIEQIERQILEQQLSCALELIKKYGTQGIADERMLQICTDQICTSLQWQEDRWIVAQAYELFRKNCYNETTQQYLLCFFSGSIEEMMSLWKTTQKKTEYVLKLEERLLKGILFEQEKEIDSLPVFLHYYEEGKNRLLVQACFHVYAYWFLVFHKNYEASFFALLRNEERNASFEERRLYRMALQNWQSQQDETIPLGVKTIWYTAESDQNIFLHYKKEGQEDQFVVECLQPAFFHVYCKTFLLFPKEKIVYYITEGTKEKMEPVYMTLECHLIEEEKKSQYTLLATLSNEVYEQKQSEKIEQWMETYMEQDAMLEQCLLAWEQEENEDE